MNTTKQLKKSHNECYNLKHSLSKSKLKWAEPYQKLSNQKDYCDHHEQDDRHISLLHEKTWATNVLQEVLSRRSNTSWRRGCRNLLCEPLMRTIFTPILESGSNTTELRDMHGMSKFNTLQTHTQVRIE